MKRRNFLRYMAQSAAATPFLLNGLQMKAIGNSGWFKRFNNDPFENRKLVLIQLHGGNDGLNTVIPMEQYSTYQTFRSNIAIPDTGNRSYIPLDNSMPIPDQVGLHPDMPAVKALYDEGKVSLIQGVGYENTNQSHFRSRDIWFMGGGYDEYKNSGWMGRYLDHIYPDYPDSYPTTEMPDPLGLEIGYTVSLGYHRSLGIPVALATADPENFSDLIAGLGGPNPDTIPDNYYGDELQYVMDLYANANTYAQQLQDRYNAGANYVVYPMDNIQSYPGEAPQQYIENPLGWQLATVARLIHGGCKTRIYLVRIGGYDTHDGQVIDSDPTRGIHSALLYHLSNAVKAFMDDLAASGYEEEVMAMTFTDFGRRPFSNASFGTDHGTAAPVFIFGKGVQPGVIGTNPDLNDLDDTNNLKIQNDYRQIITSLLCDWMGADLDALTAAEFDSFADQKLPVVHPDYSDPITSVDPIATAALTAKVFPNPAVDVINYTLHSEVRIDATLAVYDLLGRKLISRDIIVEVGENTFSEDISTFGQGTFILNVRDAEGKNLVTKEVVKR